MLKKLDLYAYSFQSAYRRDFDRTKSMPSFDKR